MTGSLLGGDVNADPGPEEPGYEGGDANADPVPEEPGYEGGDANADPVSEEPGYGKSRRANLEVAGNRDVPGCRISVSTSSESTSRGPGRLKR